MLAVGGSGQLCEAWHRALHREVVVKIGKAADAAVVDQFGRELAASRLLAGTSAALPIVDAGTTADGRPWVALDRAAGGSLGTWCSRRPADPTGIEAAALSLGVARCLAVAHASGVRHGDLTPANVVRLSDGSVRLVDFGSSVVVGYRPEPGLFHRGTPGHSAPERLAGAPATISSDLFSLGTVIEALLGFAPDSSADTLPPATGGDVHSGSAHPNRPIADRGDRGIDEGRAATGGRSEVKGQSRCDGTRARLARLAEGLTDVDPLRRPSSCDWVVDRLEEILDAERSASGVGPHWAGSGTPRRNLQHVEVAPSLVGKSAPQDAVTAVACALVSGLTIAASVLAHTLI